MGESGREGRSGGGDGGNGKINVRMDGQTEQGREGEATRTVGGKHGVCAQANKKGEMSRFEAIAILPDLAPFFCSTERHHVEQALRVQAASVVMEC